MTVVYLKLALTGLTLSFIFALALMAYFKLAKVGDPSVDVKRAVHDNPTSRLGGVAVCTAVVVAISLSDARFDYRIFIAALPIFIAGFLEDLSFYIRPPIRLFVGGLSATLYISLQGTWLSHLSIPGIDHALSISAVGWIFTIFCIVALVNALNFIDGINGLASGKTIVVSLALGALALEYNEEGLAILSLAILAATLGLFMLNYPFGRIFMGDAGAYAMGFLLSTSLITLYARHSEISPWAIMLIIFWPIMDMLHAIMRRTLKNIQSFRPDMMHMHHVIMRSLIILSGGRMRSKIANPAATAIILPLSLVPVYLGYTHHLNNTICLVLFIIFALVFMLMHAGLVWVVSHRVFGGSI